LTGDDDLLRRSMNAAPEAWLDRVVTERVLAAAQLECVPREDAAQRVLSPREVSPREVSPREVSPSDRPALPAVLRLWLGRLVPADARALFWRDGDQL